MTREYIECVMQREVLYESNGIALENKNSPEALVKFYCSKILTNYHLKYLEQLLRLKDHHEENYKQYLGVLKL